MKIISLVPSLTETLIALGLVDSLIGRTKFCIHPKDMVKRIERVGGTKNPNIDRIIALKPDLVVVNKEENRKEDIERLCKSGIEVLVTEIDDLDSALRELIRLGEATRTVVKAEELKDQIATAFSTLKPISKRVCYLIWKDPYMTIGSDTFISDVQDRCGLDNVFSDYTRYPTISIHDIKEANPDYVLLSSEPFPFKENHRIELEKQTGIRTLLVDGEYFSWYGSRMIPATQYFREFLSSL